MKIKLTSVFIAPADLDKALAFYTETLGFVKKHDMPMGDTRLVTLVSRAEPDGAELMLEPNGEHPPTKTFKRALYDEGIPLTAFLAEDVAGEVARLKKLGVQFRAASAACGGENRALKQAIFDDTFGNWIMIYQADGSAAAN